jgi:hypothetical protein
MDMSDADLMRALDELVHAAAHSRDDDRTATVLAAAVVELESAAHAPLGPSGADPLVLLQRRLGGRTGCCSVRPAAWTPAGPRPRERSPRPRAGRAAAGPGPVEGRCQSSCTRSCRRAMPGRAERDGVTV